MSDAHTIRNLTDLVRLRSNEVERLQGDMATQTALRERYKNNLARLNGMCTASGASGFSGASSSLALSVNCGNFKQAVLEMVDSHRTDLHLHEANMAVAQRALNSAWAKREVLDQVLSQKQKDVANEQHRRDNKRQDELATQLWLRSQLK